MWKNTSLVVSGLIYTQDLSLIICVILGKLFTLSEPQSIYA